MAVLGPFLPTQGLNTKANFATIPETQATTFSDWVVDFKTVQTRRGNAIRQTPSALDTGAALNGVFAWYDATNAVYAVIAGSSNGKIYVAQFSSDTGTLAFTDRTGSAAWTGIGRTTFGVLNGKVIMASGLLTVAGAPQKMTAWNTNNAALGGAPPSGAITHVVNNFAFLGCVTGGDESRVYWSEIADPETWDAPNFVDFNKKDGDVISALGSIGTDLFIFKFRSMGRLNTNPPSALASVSLGPLTQVSRNIGCAGPQALDYLPDGRIVFLGGDNHLYFFDGVTITDVSDAPYPSLNFQGTLSLLSPPIATRAYSVVKVDPTQHRIYISGTTANTDPNDLLVAYDYINQSVSKITGTVMNGATSMANGAGTSGYPRIFFSGDGTGHVVQLNDVSTSTPTNDAGATVTADMVFSINFSGEATDFIPRSAIILQNKAAMTVTFGFDGTMNSASTYNATPGNARQVIPISVKNLSTYVKPQSLQIRIQSSAALAIYGVYISDEVAN